MPYSQLLRPLTVGQHHLSNRIVRPAMGNNLADAEGLVTPRMVDCYAARAQSRPGLCWWWRRHVSIIIPRARPLTTHLLNYDARALEGLTQLAAAIKAQGVTTILQRIHPRRPQLPARPRGRGLRPQLTARPY